MHDLMKLKEMLCKELEQYGAKGELSGGALEIVDKLAHAVKNLDRIIESYEDEEYSMRGSYAYDDGNQGGSYRGGRYSRNRGSYRGGNQGGSYDGGGGSYARGRGQNARRDSMGRYSRGGSPDEMVAQLEDLMEDAPNDQIKQQIKQLVQQLEQM